MLNVPLNLNIEDEARFNGGGVIDTASVLEQ